MIELRGLTKHFRGRVAVEDVWLKLNNGRVYALLGAPGAGKSTLLGLLAGVIRPTDGVVRVGGFDLSREPKRAMRSMAYLPSGAPLPSGLTVEEYLFLESELYGIPFERAIRGVQNALEITDTLKLRTTPIARLSSEGGVRVAIAGMLVSGAETLIMDEPTLGLTRSERESVCQILQYLAKTKTLILASESWELAEALGADVLWMRSGEPIEHLTAEELTPDTVEQIRASLVAAPASKERTRARVRREYDGEYEIIDTDKEGRR